MSEYEIFDMQQNNDLIDEEKRTFFEIILPNLEKQIQGTNAQTAVSDLAAQLTFSEILQRLDQATEAERTSLIENNKPRGQLPKSFIGGPAECTVADLAMFHEIQNHFGILKLLNTEGADADNVRGAVDIKYPWVAAWLRALESLAVVRSY